MPIDLSTASKQRSEDCHEQDLSAVDPMTAFDIAMAENGLSPGDIKGDGGLHRFDVDEQGDLAGWYVLHLDGVPAGAFGNWKTGFDKRWCTKQHQEMTEAERAENRRRIEEARRQQEQERIRQWEEARDRLKPIFDAAGPPDPNHPHLVRKGVKPHGDIRQTGDKLLVPMFDENFQFWNYQELFPEKREFKPGTKPRDKNFPRGGRRKGCFGYIHGEGDPIICEGYSTGATIQEATGRPVYLAFSANNIPAVAKIIREKCPTASIVIAGDDDRFKPEKGNAGRKYAEQAAKDIDGRAVFPSGCNGTDFNDLAAEKGLAEVKRQIGGIGENVFSHPVNISKFITTKPPKRQWSYSERLLKGRGHVLTGLGGSSKTRLLYQLAVGSNIGRVPWGWKVNTIGKAVLILTEDTEEDVHHTLYGLARGLKLSDEEKAAIASSLIVYPLAGQGLTLLQKTSTGTLERTPYFNHLVETIQGIGGVVFIGIDPALGVSEGDELNQNDQRRLGEMIDGLSILTGATGTLVSHATKASLAGDEMTSHASRGGGAITDAVRGEFAMRNMTVDEARKAGITDIEERKRLVQLVATKGNHLPPSAYVPVWLRRDDTGTLSEIDIDTSNGTLTDRDLKILSVHAEIDRFSTPTISEWRQKCIDADLIKGTTDEAKNQAMKRVCAKLVKAGYIEKGTGRGVWRSTGLPG